MYFLVAGMLALVLSSHAAPTALENDPHSYSRPHEIAVKSVDLDLNVDFDRKVISGAVTYELDNKTSSNTLYLDTKDLKIGSVTASPGNQSLEYTVGTPDPILGSPLSVQLPPGQVRSVTIHYETKPSAGALNWLEPEQTVSGKPFLFSLSAPILARTWIPCQDTPSVRAPYRAKVRTRKDLLALMSARNPTAKSRDGRYEFVMPQPVPAYLIALAVGDIRYRTLGPRSGVYAEPGLIKAAAREFGQAERILRTAESLFGPFMWDRADILVLPYSFPYGGMENPRLTFLNAAMVVGDRSMINIVAHEYAHYWSGNLVLPATWNDFWLNEGITSYAEVRIIEAIYGKALADQMELRNFGELQDAFNALKGNPADTHLRLNLAGRDPEDGINAVAYQKGAFFLKTIEEAVGRQKFDRFLKSYFERFRFQSITSADFLSFLNQTLGAENPGLGERLRVDAWVNGPGLPTNAPAIHSERAAQIGRIAEIWKTAKPVAPKSTAGWTPFDLVNLLDILGGDVPAPRMGELDRVFHVSGQRNPEVLYRWFKLVIRNHHAAEYQHLREFLIRTGRGKYIKPLYRELAQTPEGKRMALEIFAQARGGYHPIMQKSCAKLLQIE